MSDKNVTIKEEDIVMNLEILEDNGEVFYANQVVECALLSKRKRDTSELDIQKNECSVDKKANIQAKVVKPEAGVVKSDETGNAEPKVIPMNRDSYFYCRRCNENMKGCREYYSHLKSMHNIKPNINNVKHLDLQPDVDDPNFYCRSCERSHPDRNLYNTHLRRVHHMLLKPLGTPKKKDILPNPKDPNNYCTVCKKAYSKSSFKRHLFLAHKIDIKFSVKKHSSANSRAIIQPIKVM